MRHPLEPIRIAVIVNNVEGYARGVLRGITSFAFARAWECQVQGVSAATPLEPLGPVDGMIVQASSPQSITRLRESPVPTVNVSSAMNLADVHSVVCDDQAVGRLGAEHFLRQGFRRFAFYSPIETHYARLRQQGFSARLTENRFDVHVVTDRAALARALFDSEKPLAVMSVNDAAALEVLDQCRADGWRVPDDVAVLGVDNDDLFQSLANPPLSSVNTATVRIGFEAAALLETLIGGNREPPGARLVPPVGVVTRQSTDIVAVADRDVAEAVRFIRTHAGSPIGVEDILAGVTVSRRQLERRFRATLGRSVLDEIRRCRIDRARQLLIDTDLTIPQVASASGFATSSYLTVVFKQETGATPGAFRDQHRQ